MLHAIDSVNADQGIFEYASGEIHAMTVGLLKN